MVGWLDILNLVNMKIPEIIKYQSHGRSYHLVFAKNIKTDKQKCKHTSLN